MSVCEALARLDKLEGATVRIRGVLDTGMEHSYLDGADCGRRPDPAKHPGISISLAAAAEAKPEADPFRALYAAAAESRKKRPAASSHRLLVTFVGVLRTKLPPGRDDSGWFGKYGGGYAAWLRAESAADIRLLLAPRAAGASGRE